MRGFQPAKAKAAKPFAIGGPVRGPGTGTSDEVQDEVPEGTYIMPADSTQAVGAGQLASMGARGFVPGSEKVPVQLSNGEYKLPPEQVRLLADGRIYTGRQALASGLVDEMGNLYDAIDGTVDKLGLAERPVIREMGQTSPWDALFGRTTVSSLVQQAVWQALGTAPKAAPVLAPMALPATY